MEHIKGRKFLLGAGNDPIPQFWEGVNCSLQFSQETPTPKPPGLNLASLVTLVYDRLRAIYLPPFSKVMPLLNFTLARILLLSHEEKKFSA